MFACIENCGGETSLAPRTPACFGVHRAGLFRFLAIVNCLMNLIAWVLLIVDVVTNLNFPNDARRSVEGIHMIVWAWGLFHQCVQCTLDLLLYLRAESTNATFLRTYIIYTTASFPLLLLILVKVSYCKVLKTRVRHETRWLIPGYFVYKIYLCYVLNGYKNDIRWEKELKSGRRNLFHHELYQFEEGIEASAGIQEWNSEISCEERALLGKYKKEEFEIIKEALDFAEATMIGSGEFGHVYKLNLTTRKMEKIIQVAVKTIDSDLNDATCFKALLAEAKVMTFLGKHENVVELIGLRTKDIRFRKLYIVLELCAFGSLHTYLISERATFSPSSDIESNNYALNEAQLIRWCLEIARGMEYLATQKVVHGDLATRNVLLNENRTAKITDFGLSRRLYNYSVYVRRKNTPLPWRWLSVEAIVDK
ncbi:Fibroblast growth factor receptor 3 [Orchesella cincta]|uniref:Fibroblast growth factor receptor 3 n=1 Tax=Orchesella cincta TaxID=48709 RepID=A0A1D2M7G8_ORCCI|nr:Fibroblast growth factor receptor 3 [Orchesella cincta]